jgi:hypothetical protein
VEHESSPTRQIALQERGAGQERRRVTLGQTAAQLCLDVVIERARRTATKGSKVRNLVGPGQLIRSVRPGTLSKVLPRGLE